MSSSSSYHPSHLHRVNLHSHGKRPFEECGGYDSDPDTPMSLTQPTTSGTSSSTHNRRFPSTSSPPTEARNKRARSTSSSNTDDSTSSNISSSTGYNTAQSSSRSDLLPDGPSALPANAVDCPIPRISPSPPFVPTQDVHMSDLHIPIPPPLPQHPHAPAPQTPEDTLRSSLQRFAEFDRQIAALRTSLAVSRSPPLPPLGFSDDGDSASPNDPWDPSLPSFLSNSSAGEPAPSTTDPGSSTVAVAQSESLNSLSTFLPSNDNLSVTVTTTTASGSTPSASFSPTYSNVPRYPPYPSYRPSAGTTSSPAVHERPGDAISSISAPLFMRPSSSENTAQARSGVSLSTSVQASGSTSSTPYPRAVNRSLSPLAQNPEPPSSSSSSLSALVADDILSRYRTLLSDIDAPNPRGRPSGRAAGVSRDSPVSSAGRGDMSSHWMDRLGSSSPNRIDARVRVIREHSLEREPVPTVFDVFNLGEPSQERNRSSPFREPAASRYTSMTDSIPSVNASETVNDRPRGFASTTSTANASQARSQDPNPRPHTSWSSIPSSNSLMSESASERRNALALERFRERLRPSSIDADDESESRYSSSSRDERERENGRDRGVGSPDPPSPSGSGVGPSSHVPPHLPQSTNRTERGVSLRPSFSDLVSETDGIIGGGIEMFFLDWDPERGSQAERERRERERERERQRERTRAWERERERLRERFRQTGPGEISAFGLGLHSMSSAREEPSHRPTTASSGPVRPSVGQLGTGANTIMATATSATTTSTSTTNNSHQYPYSNLNLSSFQSGLFRDSLRRNAEVDQVPSSANGAASAVRVGQTQPQPVIPPITSGIASDSSSQLGMDLDDSGSEMDLDITTASYRPRPPSPEWSRPHPYAGRTPPPDYSPPPRNFGAQPRFSVLRRGSVNLDTHGRSQPFNRTTPPVNRPVSSTSTETARPNLYAFGVPPPNEINNRPTERPERDRFFPARILDSLYRSNDDGRRNTSFGPGLSPQQQQHHSHNPPHNQNHALASGSNVFSRNERSEVSGPRNAGGNGTSENRRSSLGLGGSIRSRLARFANSQSSSNATDTSPSRQRSPSHPAGGRPQTVEQHRRGSSVFGVGNIFDHDSRTDSRRASGPPSYWSTNPGTADPSPIRDVPWRSASGPRSSLAATSTSTTGNARTTDAFDVANRAEERSRLRTLRQRLQLDRGGEGIRVFRPGMLRSALGRRNMGDYVPDELFDDSYEALLSLSSMLGEVRSKATPEDVISSLPTGTFKEWKTEDSETRCPICLDDYEPSDVLAKLLECPHWLHKNCLEQWLRTANTCPVCREKVKASPKPGPARRRPYHRDISWPPETIQGASTSGNGPSVRPSQANPQTSGGRPTSFAAMVFDRLMNEERETPGDQSSSSSPQAPRRDPDIDGLLQRVRAQRLQQQQQLQQQQHRPHQHPQTHTHNPHDVLVPLSPRRELPHHLRVVPPIYTESGASLSRFPAVQRMGPGSRPHVLMPLRGRDSDSSMSSSSSRNTLAEDLDRMSDDQHLLAAFGPQPVLPSFFDAPTTYTTESEMNFLFPSSSSTPFTGSSVPSSSQQQLQPSADSRPSTMVIPNPTVTPVAPRSNATPFNAPVPRPSSSLFHLPPPRLPSSSIPPRHVGAADRVPGPLEHEDHLFRWSVRQRQHPYYLESEDESNRRVDGGSSNPSPW